MNRIIHQLRGRLVRERGEMRVRVDKATRAQTLLVSDLEVEVQGPDGSATIKLNLSQNPMIPTDVNPADVQALVVVELLWPDPAISGSTPDAIEATAREDHHG